MIRGPMRFLTWQPSDAAGAVIVLLAVTALPGMIENEYYVNVLVLLFLYAGLASAWNIIGGIAGQFSLGHAAFFGIGAYSSTLLYNYLGVSPWIGMLAGGAISVALAAAIAWPVFRMRGVFFAMATLAVSETIRILLIYVRKFVPLPYSLSINFEPGLSRMIFADRADYAYLTGGYLVVVLAATFVLSRSYMGYYLRAIRDSEDAADAAGIAVRRNKLIALLVSAFLTSIGGTLMAQYVLYIEPGTVFALEISVDLPLIAILGGIGTILGPTVGAAILLPLREFLVEQLGGAGAGAHLVIYGLLLVLIVIVLPQGLLGGVRGLLDRAQRPRLPAVRQPEAR